MKRKIVNYFIFFLFLFICNLIVNHFLKHDFNILTAFSTALGLSIGVLFVKEKRKRLRLRGARCGR